MDPTVVNEPGNPQSDGVGEKRRPDNGEIGEASKKPRLNGEEMKRVAEIVLVLSAMGRMRGGKSPTETEIGLMAEARAKLADMCQQFAPRDIVGRDAIGAVIEDLGLNGKMKDQRLGFRAPRLIISEKVSLSKRKMEESKKYPSTSTAFTSHLPQQSAGASAERQGISPLGSATHTVRMLPSDKASHAPISSGGFPASTPYVAAASNTPVPNQWPGNEVKVSTPAGAMAGSYYTRDSSALAQPRIDGPQVKLDGGSNVHISAPQGQGISSTNHPMVNAPSWSAHPQSAFSIRPTAENKVPHPVKAGDQNFRPLITQTTPGNFTGTNQPMQNTSFTQASPFGSSHAEIARIIQRFLQPRARQNPTWNPPSREYMNKAMTCQICQVTINEVDTVLICDACERAYHLKCLQANNLKGIPKFEWHCTKCVQACMGKPFPPKYGRVMRSMNTPKVPSNAAGVQLPAEKKVGTHDPRVNQRKANNANPGLQAPPGFGSGGISSPALASNSETANATTNAILSGTANATLNATTNETPNASTGLQATAGTGTLPISHSEKTSASAAVDAIDARLELQTPAEVGAGVSNSLEPKSHTETPNSNESLERDLPSSKREMDQSNDSASGPDNSMKSWQAHSAPSVAPSSEKYDQHNQIVESAMPQNKAVPHSDAPVSQPSELLLSNIVKESDHSQPENNTQNVQAGVLNNIVNESEALVSAEPSVNDS